MSNPLFTTIPLPKVSRNIFKLGHSNKFTMTAQKLYPTLLMEGLPGDRNLVFAECMVRAMPLVAPVFQSYSISHHAFFVPMRTLSKNWENFITGGKDGTYSSVLPYTTYSSIFSYVSDMYDRIDNYLQVDPDDTCSSLLDDERYFLEHCVDVFRMLDFMGLSFVNKSFSGVSVSDSAKIAETAAYKSLNYWTGDGNFSYYNCDVPVNLAPFMAALKVWTEYYRDENLVSDPYQDYVLDILKLDTVVGFQDISSWSVESFVALFSMRPRAWKKDRFTSALPFTQRGPDVLLPIAGSAPVDFITTEAGTSAVTDAALKASYPATTSTSKPTSLNAGAGKPVTASVDFGDAELTSTINDFRRAERLQRWYENSARGGSRLNENTLAHWGVHTPDATLDRAVFLGGMHQPLVISEVEQNSQTDTTPQGTLAGKGTSYNNGRLFKHYDSEHGFTIVFTSILQHGDYCQGTPQVFTRQDRYEYAWPEFANLGEEPIYSRELYTLDGNGTVFGYTPRYSCYKSMPNEIHGDMRTSLAHWSVPRLFSEAPKLSADFVYNPPSKIAFAVESGETDEFVAVIRYGIKSSRLLPFYGVPTI